MQMRLEGSTLQLAGWASAHKIARDYLQADPQAVRVLIDKLQTDGVIGSGKKVMFHNGQPVLAFPPADIETIMTAFRQKIPERTQIPDGYLRLSQLEPHLAINLNSLRQLSHLLVSQGEMPPATVYRYARAYSSAYSPEQISVIEQAVNRLPRQQKTLAKLLGCQFSDIGRVIMDLIHDGQLIQKVFYDTHDQKLIIDAYCTRMGDSYRTDLYQQPKLTGYLEFLAQNG